MSSGNFTLLLNSLLSVGRCRQAGPILTAVETCVRWTGVKDDGQVRTGEGNVGTAIVAFQCTATVRLARLERLGTLTVDVLQTGIAHYNDGDKSG